MIVVCGVTAGVVVIVVGGVVTGVVLVVVAVVVGVIVVEVVVVVVVVVVVDAGMFITLKAVKWATCAVIVCVVVFTTEIKVTH